LGKEREGPCAIECGVAHSECPLVEWEIATRIRECVVRGEGGGEAEVGTISQYRYCNANICISGEVWSGGYKE